MSGDRPVPPLDFFEGLGGRSDRYMFDNLGVRHAHEPRCMSDDQGYSWVKVDRNHRPKLGRVRERFRFSGPALIVPHPFTRDRAERG